MLLVGLVVIAGAVIYLLGGSDGMRSLLALKDTVSEWCVEHPSFLFLALAILPAFGLPASPILILAGAVWGSTWQACLTAVLAMAINMSLAYFLAAGPASLLITKLLGARWQHWKNVRPENLLKFVVILRVTPGIPFFLQNYISGLLGVPFLQYIAVSVPLNGIIVVGFVLTGGAIFEGRVGMILAGAAVIVVATLSMRLLRAKLSTISPPPGKPG